MRSRAFCWKAFLRSDGVAAVGNALSPHTGSDLQRVYLALAGQPACAIEV